MDAELNAISLVPNPMFGIIVKRPAPPTEPIILHCENISPSAPQTTTSSISKNVTTQVTPSTTRRHRTNAPSHKRRVIKTETASHLQYY